MCNLGFKLPVLDLFRCIFLLPDAPNVWIAGRPVQHLDFSTIKPCFCNGCSLPLSCRKIQGLPWKTRWLDESICCAKTCIHCGIDVSFSCVQVVSFYSHLCTARLNGVGVHRLILLNQALIRSYMVPLLISPENVVSMIFKSISNFDFSDHRAVFHFAKDNFKWTEVI